VRTMAESSACWSNGTIKVPLEDDDGLYLLP
jgi:hypothetical protein